MQEQEIIQNIRRQYGEHTPTDMERLQMLDRTAKRPATIFALIFGVIGTLVLGTGMCLAMQVIASGNLFMLLGIVIGILGIALVSVNYFIYRAILKRSRRKYSKQILELSDKLLNTISKNSDL